MTDLTICGGSDVHGAPLTVAITGGVITDTTPSATVFDASGLTVAPGFIDLQVNGAVGIEVTAEPERLWELAAALPQVGVTAFLPTVITSSPTARDSALGVLSAGPPPGWAGAVPLGLHLEGPMISPRRKGAHPERWLADPSLELIDGWSRDAGVLLVTLAPELEGALDVIATLRSRGVVVSVGHTEASAAQVAAAVDAGATLVTHLGNAMPPLRSREPGPVGAALGGADLVAGMITDGHHLDGLMVTTVWRALGPDRFLVVTDSTAALGLGDGPSRLGEQEVMVRDGVVRLGDGNLAGSASSLSQCLRFLRTATGCTLAEAVRTCTTTAATALGEASRGEIRPGARGDLTLLDEQLDVVATVIGGRLFDVGHR